MGQSESKSETERAIPLKKRTQSAEGKARHHVTGSNHKHITRKSTSNLVNEIDSIEDSGCSSNGSGSLQSSVKTGRCMHHPTVEQNDISKQSSKKELLTKRQKILLRGSWNKCQRSGLDNIGAVIFTKIYILDPTVGHMFDLYNVPIPDLKYKKFFQSHAMTFTRSLDFCIQNMDNMDTIVEYFYQLGRRHVKYKKLGFKPHYWDIFSEALTEAVIEYECGFKHRDVLKGWRTLITFIIEQMREGYLDENKSLLKKDHTSSTDGMNSIAEKCEDTVHKSFNNYFHIDDALAKDQTSCPSEPYYQHHFKNSRCQISNIGYAHETTPATYNCSFGKQDLGDVYEENLIIPRINCNQKHKPNLLTRPILSAPVLYYNTIEEDTMYPRTNSMSSYENQTLCRKNNKETYNHQDY